MASSVIRPASKRTTEKEIEIVFEYQGNRLEVKCKRSVMKSKIEDALISIQTSLSGPSSAQANLAQPTALEVHTLQSIKKVSRKRLNNKRLYFVQRYISDWKGYINVDSTAQIKNKDVVTVVKAVSQDESPDLGRKQEVRRT